MRARGYKRHGVPSGLLLLFVGWAPYALLVGAFLFASIALIASCGRDAPDSAATSVRGPGVPPTGFAEACVGAYLAQSWALERGCGFSKPGRSRSERPRLRVAEVWAHPQYPLTVPVLDQERRNLSWSILTTARLQRPATSRPGWVDLPFVSYRATITERGEGRLVLAGPPRQVPTPVGPSVRVDADLAGWSSDDPRVDVLRSYVRRYLRAGLVGNLLVPRSREPVTVHDPSIRSVRLLRVSFNDRSDGDVDALAEVQVRYVGGGEVVQWFPAVLRRTGQGQWLIREFPLVVPVR